MADSMEKFETKPTPDPTVLTTEQLLREVDRVKDLLQAKVDGITAVVNERFKSVDQIQTLLEKQRIEQKADAEKALTAALSAAEKAVREQTTASERAIATNNLATKEQLNQQQTTFAAQINGASSATADLKTRVERIENIKQGGNEQKDHIYSLIAAFGVLILSALGILAAIVANK